MKSIFKLSLGLLLCAGVWAQTTGYKVTNIATNSTDTNLVNPWGLSRPNNSDKVEPHWWAADNVTGVSTLYDANGTVPPMVITVPPASGSGAGSPTGTVFWNHTFYFSTLDGTISAWFAGTKPTGGGTKCAECHVLSATIKLDHSASGASYQGMAVVTHNGTTTFYAANANGGIEAYDTSFNPVTLPAGAFTDPKIPAAYTPAGIQAIGTTLYVTYNRNAGGGTGYVDAFTMNGKRLLRLENGWFNQPWGVAKAPSNFGALSNMLLVGNTGSGWIGAYNATTGAFQGFMTDSVGNDVTIPGLWGLGFGAGNSFSGPKNVLYFNAGGGNLNTGAFGAIAAN